MEPALLLLFQRFIYSRFFIFQTCGGEDFIHVKIQNLIIIAIIFNSFGSFYLGLYFVIMKYISPNLCFFF